MTAATPNIKYFENDLFVLNPANIMPYSQDWQDKSDYLTELFARKMAERQQNN